MKGRLVQLSRDLLEMSEQENLGAKAEEGNTRISVEYFFKDFSNKYQKEGRKEAVLLYMGPWLLIALARVTTPLLWISAPQHWDCHRHSGKPQSLVPTVLSAPKLQESF